MLSLRLAVATICAAAFMSQPVFAQSLTGNVGSAGVTDGEQAVEFRIGIDDDGNSAWRLHYDYAPTGWYQVRVTGNFARPDGEPVDYRGLTIENWFQWSEEAEDNSGFNGGFRVSYAILDDRPDVVELRLTLTDKFAEFWEWRANVIGDIEVGQNGDSGVFLESRAQLTRAIDFSALGAQKWRLGAEVFSEYGNTTGFFGFTEQAHQIGPVVKASWDNGVYIQSAVRFGLTEGSDDAMMKFFIGKEF